jgi:hypothetical protein
VSARAALTHWTKPTASVPRTMCWVRLDIGLPGSSGSRRNIDHEGTACRDSAEVRRMSFA